MIESTPKFLQAIISTTGSGIRSPKPLGDLSYTVPPDRRAQTIYLRAGNSCDAMVALVLMCDGKPMRYFPIGAKSAAHVPLAVVEDLEPEQKLEVYLAAPEGMDTTIVLDLGLMEI